MIEKNNAIIIVGYSGHAYVVCDCAQKNGLEIVGYCEPVPRPTNPFDLPYLGHENSELTQEKLMTADYFVAIGDNQTRRKITEHLQRNTQKKPFSLIHPSAIVGVLVEMGAGVLVAAGAKINVLAHIGDGVICNTGSIVEHECSLGAFVHLAPGAVLCGNVRVGENSFIGANAVVKQGVKIGTNVVVGAGAVVLKDVPDNATVVGNPAQIKT